MSLRPDARRDAQGGADRREDRDQRLDDDFPSLFFHVKF